MLTLAFMSPGKYFSPDLHIMPRLQAAGWWTCVVHPHPSHYSRHLELFQYLPPDYASTWAPVSLTQPLTCSLFLYLFDLQHKQTASCGLLTARATRPYLCRVVSTAFLIQWSFLAGEQQTGTLDLTWNRPSKLLCIPMLFATHHDPACRQQ